MKLWHVIYILVRVSELFEKFSDLVNIRYSLLCVTNHSIKVAIKLILFSVSRFKFSDHYRRRVKEICINVSQTFSKLQKGTNKIKKMNASELLTLIRLSFLNVVFRRGEGGWELIWSPLHISRKNLISI